MFLKNFQVKALILLVIIFAISCEPDKILQDDPVETIRRDKLSGYVQKGPFINGTSISMFELNSSMEQTGRAFNTQIHNNQGSFEVNNVELSSPYVELSSNGYYYNEINGQVTQSPINLLALSDISDKSTINVNILTHLEKRRVEYLISQGSSFSEAKETAQAEVLAIFGIEKSDIASSETLDISIENEDNAILIAISIILQGDRTPGQLTELLANITTDIRGDGMLNNQDIHEGLRNSAVNLDFEAIRNNLENRYQELDIEASIPEFESYVYTYLSFTAQKPSAITKEATEISDSSVTLHAKVNPNSSPTSVNFEYGITTDYGNVVEAEPSPVFGTEEINIHAYIDGLSENTVYYFRVKTENKIGITYGANNTFKTFGKWVSDIDGNVYQTVNIGGQLWMAENLKVTRYRNGDAIPTNLDNNEWNITTSGAYAIFPHSNVDGINSEEEMVITYGKLYNWFAVDDPRGLCPEGWHVPTDAEWMTLVNYLGGSNVAGGKMKSTRTEPDPHPRWDSPNTGATNKSGFSGLPGGFRLGDGVYYFIGRNGFWWGSTWSDTYPPGSRYLIQGNSYVSRFGYGSGRNGYSVRCIRDD